MKLFLEDLQDMTEEQILQHFVDEYEAPKDQVDKYEVLVAYESVGSWGCDSSSYFLLRDKSSGGLFEFSGSHCSCYGFEGQFDPQPTSVEYLKSDKFHFYCGGYDDNETKNQKAVIRYMQDVLQDGTAS